MAAATRAFQPRQSGVWVMTCMTIEGCKNTRIEVQLQVTQNHIDKVQRTVLGALARSPLPLRALVLCCHEQPALA